MLLFVLERLTSGSRNATVERHGHSVVVSVLFTFKQLLGFGLIADKYFQTVSQSLTLYFFIDPGIE
jgi:hypothetical protein